MTSSSFLSRIVLCFCAVSSASGKVIINNLYFITLTLMKCPEGKDQWNQPVQGGVSVYVKMRRRVF